MAGTFGIAVDIGGTFTDVVLRSSAGRVWADKALTTHGDLLDGALVAVRQVLGKAGIKSAAVSDLFVHATTIVTNALIERNGPRTALLVTQGFRDVLIIRNEHRYDMFDPQIEFPAPLVPRDLTFGIEERMLADGTEYQALNKASALATIAELKRLGAQSVAVCLLNAYRNGRHERQLAQLLSNELPDAFLSLSCEVSPQIREYPRASTTAINAYTMPIVKPYLTRLAHAVAAEGFPNKPLIMLSNGGFVGIDTAAHHPVRMIESGPAAGALAASHFARRLGSCATDVVRHGRNHGKGLPDRGRAAADRQRVRSRSHVPLQARQRAAGRRALHRHDRSRRRRRLDRPRGRARSPEGRAAERRLRAGAGLLRARRHAADRDRRRRGARPDRPATLPRRRHGARRRCAAQASDRRESRRS